MKHLYLTCFYLLVCAGWMSAREFADMNQFKCAEAPVSVAFDGSGIKNAAAYATEYSIAAGQYTAISLPIELSTSTVGSYVYGGATEIAENGEDQFLLKNFLSLGFGMETCDLPASVAYNATYGTMLSIPGSGQVPLLTYNGENYCLWLMAYVPSTGKFALIENDIVFIAGENGSLRFPSYRLDGLPDDAITGIAYVSGSGRGGLLGEPCLDLANGVMKTQEKTSSSTEWEYKEYPINVQIFDAFAGEFIFYAWGMGDAFGSCGFFFSESGYAYASDQVAYAATAYGDLYYTDRLTGAYLEGKYTKDDQKETIAIDHEWWFGNSQGWVKSFANTTIEHYLDTSGVKEPETTIGETGTAAPEYYNMMGIRVANPIPGQPYILKQGTATSKVVY